jgi:hypothetical protein
MRKQSDQREQAQKRAAVVLRIAISDHCLWSRTRDAYASLLGKVTSGCQLIMNQERIF